ncbi:hypothetical protein [Desulfobacula sp.]|uniref:hypothetical protein n=1 Tax=Desulfobacula sp. TaxID=2593537 RepID=UPI0026069C95|nr:hypothetical protein [Desulfobacula sp.]
MEIDIPQGDPTFRPRNAQRTIFQNIKEKNNNIKKIGANLFLIFNSRNKNLVTLKNRDVIVKKADLSDKPAKKLFVIDAFELGATKYLLADALKISRQTIHNYI